MKRKLLVVAAALVAVFCGGHLPPIVGGGGWVLFAQTLPSTAHFSWDANAASENVQSYVTSLDTGPSQTQPITVCTAGRCTVAISIPSFGSHTITVAGQNLTLSNVLQTGAVASLTFSLNPVPALPKNLAIAP